jgi:hypothetical protein
MSYGADVFIELIDRWMRDARFHQIVRYGQERHWLARTRLRETNHSDILAWLLDPDEGHGLGDFFLRRLLVEAMTADDNVALVQRLVDSRRWPGLADVFADGLQGFQIAREVACGEIRFGKKREKGYLDLFLLNRHRKMAVLIERKASRLAYEAQLEKYEAWIQDHMAQYQVLRIVSDTGVVDQAFARNRGWLVIDDDWLVDALRAAVRQHRAADRVCARLADYLDVLEWDEEADPFYSGVEKDLDEFAAAHAEDIQRLRGMKLMDIQVRQLDVRRFMGDLLPKLAHRKIHLATKALIEKAGELATRYWRVIDTVLDRNAFNLLQASVEDSMPSTFAFRYRTRRTGEQAIVIAPAKFEGRHKFPLILEVRQAYGADAEALQTSRIHLRLRVQAGGFTDEERAAGAVTSVLASCGRKPTSHDNVTIANRVLDKPDVAFEDIRKELLRLTELGEIAESATQP